MKLQAHFLDIVP